MPITIQQSRTFEGYYRNSSFYNLNQPVQSRESMKKTNFSLLFKISFYAFFGIVLLMSLVSSFIFDLVKKIGSTSPGSEMDNREPNEVWAY